MITTWMGLAVHEVITVTTSGAASDYRVILIIQYHSLILTKFHHHVVGFGYTWYQYPIKAILLSGVPDYFGRNKISSGGDLSHYSSASLY